MNCCIVQVHSVPREGNFSISTSCPEQAIHVLATGNAAMPHRLQRLASSAGFAAGQENKPSAIGI